MKASRSLRILVAEDNRTNQMVLGQILKQAGHEAVMVENGDLAVDALLQDDFDLVLMDVNMPVMNGYELVCEVRRNVLLDHIKIMMVTTESSMEKVQQALEAGANEYLMKPFTKDVLLEKLTLLGMA